MKRDYFAVFRMDGGTAGRAISFEAEDLSAALKKLVEKASVTSTAAFAEYEMYEVVGPRKYVVVASRLPDGVTKERGPFEYDTKDDKKKPEAPPKKPEPYQLFKVGTL